MRPQAFENLCKLLSNEGCLRPTQQVSIEELVAKFLHVLSHNVRNRTISFFFRQFTEATSCHFHRVLRAIILLEEKFLEQPNRDKLSPEVQNSPRFYLYL